MINRQARAITGALKTTPIGPLVKEAALVLAVPLLNNRQRRFAIRALKLPTSHPINSLLPPTLRIGRVRLRPKEARPEISPETDGGPKDRPVRRL